MSNKNKKRILTLALVIALLSIVMVGGSLAWFTDNDSAKNTFTVGSVEIKQIEQQYNENGELEDFENGKQLLPIIDTATPSDDTNYQHKIVTVKNEGKNAAYVRTYIAVPLKLKDYICIDVDGTGWIQEKVESHGNLFVYTYRYDSRVEPGLDTEVLLKGVYMDSRVDIQPNSAGQMEFCMPKEGGGFTFSGVLVTDDTTIDVLVVTQAVQADGFDNAETALKSAFPDYPDFSKVS